MKYTFVKTLLMTGTYEVEAESEEQALELLYTAPAKYQTGL